MSALTRVLSTYSLLVEKHWPAGICIYRQRDGSVDKLRSTLLLGVMIMTSFHVGVSMQCFRSGYSTSLSWIIRSQIPAHSDDYQPETVHSMYMRYAFGLYWLHCQCMYLFSPLEASFKFKHANKLAHLGLDLESNSKPRAQATISSRRVEPIYVIGHQFLRRITPLDMVTILSAVALGYSTPNGWSPQRIMYMRYAWVPSNPFTSSYSKIEDISLYGGGNSNLVDLEWLDSLCMDVNLGVLSSPLFSFSGPRNLGWLDCLSLSSPTYGHNITSNNALKAPTEFSSFSDYSISASHFDQPTLAMDARILPQPLDFLPFPDLHDWAEVGYISTQPSNVSSSVQGMHSGFAPGCPSLTGDTNDWQSTQINLDMQANGIFTASCPTPTDTDWLYDPIGLSLDLIEPLACPIQADQAPTSAVVSSAPLESVEPTPSSETNRSAESKPIVCQHCAKSFVRSSAYKEHMNMHLGRKSHHCPSCDKPFSVRSNMLRHHRKKHPGDKNLRQAPKLTEEQGDMGNSSTPVFRERSYKDSGYSVYRLGGYGKSSCPTNDGVGPTRHVRKHARERLGGI